MYNQEAVATTSYFGSAARGALGIVQIACTVYETKILVDWLNSDHLTLEKFNNVKNVLNPMSNYEKYEQLKRWMQDLIN